MSKRSELKEASLQRVLTAGAARLRVEGLSGAAIAPVMQDAGLTHGAFYAHFSNKDELAIAAFRHALVENRPRWMGRTVKESWAQRLLRLGKRYLTAAHRDNLADSCALAAVASDAPRSTPAFRQTYEEELRKSLDAICNAPKTERIDPHQQNEAIAFMALCVGGISLARAVNDELLSSQILDACRHAAARLATSD